MRKKCSETVKIGDKDRDCRGESNAIERSVRFAGACATDSGIGHEVAASQRQVYVYLIERVSQPPKKEKEGGREKRGGN
ncbi:hypothetical protein DBV15_09763 [Temnothorax longispinosus]|uniref:Uncharacterized protein n=1 Tax=Temnothorax longispinosus TaxID=300112 RepID=A0A4S2KIS9_9HYME|nr:hypothetical protein DBV15_09763 [Temnothorax longispinosus]